MMTAVAGHSNKEVMMTMVARMMRTMTQISRMCLGSVPGAGTSLPASMLLHSVPRLLLKRGARRSWIAAGSRRV